MKVRKFTAFLLSFLLLISGCSNNTQHNTQNNETTIIPDNNTISDDTTIVNKENSESSDNTTNKNENQNNTSDTINITTNPNSEIFSNRDFEIGFEESKSALIQLNGDSATCSSNAVQISGTTITIIDEGTYILSGTLDNGMIIVNAEKTDKTQLVLNGVTIHSETSAPIYILQADKVFITLAPNSVNTLSNGGSFTAIDENNIDSVIFSKKDMTLNGTGNLTITSPVGHGIVSKKELTMTSGTYTIHSASHGLAGEDNICIANTIMNITSGKDGIHSENIKDTALGFIYIENGTFHIEAEGDGISASSYLQIQNGTFDIVSGRGHQNASQQTSNAWGGFMGGGQRPNKNQKPSNNTTTETENDSTSIKAIKSTSDLVINGGSFTIDSADDSIHSNKNVTIHGGTLQIASGDDAFHADETLTIASGTIDITTSYEGLEGLHIKISGGDIKLVATDDGINCAGGNDSSGLGGQRGNDRFGGGFGRGSSSSNGSIEISNGTLYINASGDGIDANGTVLISGGYTIICGPTKGDTTTLDYDNSAIITGGTFIGTGASNMAQTFSESTQGVISLNVGNAPAGSLITLTNDNGKELLSYTPALDFHIVILSCPDMASGNTYTVTIGNSSGEFLAN